ncbi:ComEC/Rec2 family competence protein, partial [bacterium]|nr:ComEC/Rec2 family competence protein [bacterium]
MGEVVKLGGHIEVPPLKVRLSGISYFLRSARLLDKVKGRGIMAMIGRVRQRLEQTVNLLLPEEEAMVLTNLIIGRTSYPPPKEILDAFRRTGTIHILVVSGTQVSLLLAVIWFLLKVLRLRVKRGSLAIFFVDREIRRKMGVNYKDAFISFLLSLNFLFFFSALILFYVYMTGGELPIKRAAVMGILGLIAVMLARETDVFNIFSITVLVLLMSYPPALYTMSFQLSFLAVWGLMVILPIARSLFPSPGSSLAKVFYYPFLLSLSAQTAVSPLLIHYFKILSPISLIANIFAVPLSSIILVSGLSLLPLAYLLPFLGHIIAFFLKIQISILLHLVNMFSSFPLASFGFTLPPFLLYSQLFLLALAGEMIAMPNSWLMRKIFLFSCSLFSLS